MMKKPLGLTLFVLTLLAIFSAVATANLPSPGGAPEVAAAAPAQPGCQPVLDLDKIAQSKGDTCPAAAVQKTPAPDFMAQPTRLRTCVCSCGYPCTSDADCGGALGSCRSGITCC
ncbi:MAG: hypothetical protein ACJ76Y_08085 [Thermoanaerobaculia bacterium]